MVVAALKTLTWSTVAAAAASALVLAWSDGSMPRLGGAEGETAHPARSAPSRSSSDAHTAVPVQATQHDPGQTRDRAVQ